jgi:hypothetical protein
MKSPGDFRNLPSGHPSSFPAPEGQRMVLRLKEEKIRIGSSLNAFLQNRQNLSAAGDNPATVLKRYLSARGRQVKKPEDSSH